MYLINRIQTGLRNYWHETPAYQDIIKPTRKFWKESLRPSKGMQIILVITLLGIIVLFADIVATVGRQ